MVFDKLFEKIKNNEVLLKKYESLSSTADINYKYKNALGVHLTKYCTNKCSWCCSDCKDEEENLDINYLDELLKNTTNFAVTGGEAMIHPYFKELVLKYKNLNKNKILINDYLGLTIKTSGINPNSNELLKKKYYDNLEILFQESNYTNEGIKLNVNIIFSFSDGIKPTERLENFMKNFIELESKYKKDMLNIPTIFFDVVTIQDCEQKEKVLREKYEEYFKPFKLDKYNIIKVKNSGRKETNNINSKKVCNIKDDLNIRSNGNINICCTVESEMRGGLENYANIYKHSLEEIKERKTIYIGLLKEFHSIKDDSCGTCVSKNGFNDFLKGKLEEL
jgi:hypothetical protein